MCSVFIVRILTASFVISVQIQNDQPLPAVVEGRCGIAAGFCYPIVGPQYDFDPITCLNNIPPDKEENHQRRQPVLRG